MKQATIMEPSRPGSSSFAPPRRTSTAPVTASESPSAATPPAPPPSVGGLVDTLYDHPNVKIVSFTAGGRSLSFDPRAPPDAPGSLSWSSQLERTIAVGESIHPRAALAIATPCN